MVCHIPFPGDLPDPRTDPKSPASASGFFTTLPPGKPLIYLIIMLIIYCLSSLLKCKPQEGRDFCLLYSLPCSKCLKLCLAYSKCSININKSKESIYLVSDFIKTRHYIFSVWKIFSASMEIIIRLFSLFIPRLGKLYIIFHNSRLSLHSWNQFHLVLETQGSNPSLLLGRWIFYHCAAMFWRITELIKNAKCPCECRVPKNSKKR